MEAVRSKPFLLDTMILAVIATLCLKTYTKKIYASFAFSVDVCIEVTYTYVGTIIKGNKIMQDCWNTVQCWIYVYLKWKQHVYVAAGFQTFDRFINRSTGL